MLKISYHCIFNAVLCVDSELFPGSGIIVPNTDPAKNEEEKKLYLYFQVC